MMIERSIPTMKPVLSLLALGIVALGFLGTPRWAQACPS
jgi:hypothetical protein